MQFLHHVFAYVVFIPVIVHSLWCVPSGMVPTFSCSFNSNCTLPFAPATGDFSPYFTQYYDGYESVFSGANASTTVYTDSFYCEGDLTISYLGYASDNCPFVSNFFTDSVSGQTYFMRSESSYGSCSSISTGAVWFLDSNVNAPHNCPVYIVHDTHIPYTFDTILDLLNDDFTGYQVVRPFSEVLGATIPFHINKNERPIVGNGNVDILNSTIVTFVPPYRIRTYPCTGVSK